MISFYYLAILSFLFVFLSAWVIRYRIKYRVSLGSKNNVVLEKLIRTHGNFAEYVPFSLLLLIAYEYKNQTAIHVHLMGISIIMARVFHVIGMVFLPSPNIFRTLGMVLTFLFMIVTATALIIY